MSQLSFSPQILNETFPILSRTLEVIRNCSVTEWALANLNCVSSSPSSDMFVDILLYVTLSLTSLVTAFIASKTVLNYHKSFKRIGDVVKSHLYDWAVFLFTAVWLIAVSQPYGTCVLWRWTITVYMKLRYGELGDIATGLDSAGTMDQPESRQIIKVLKVLRGKCNIQDLKEKAYETACKKDPQNGRFLYPKFHQYIDTCGRFYCWKPAIFDINHHVRFVDGMTANSASIGEDQLLETVSKYSNTAFDPQRGYWEILVIPKVHYKWEEETTEREEKFAILVRISHGIGDGFSFMKLVMREMAGEGAEEYSPPSKPRRTSWLYKVAVFFYLLFKAPRAFYKQMSLKDNNPMHNPDAKTNGEKVHVWSDPIDVEWLKLLKKELGCGMSSILLNTLGSACRKYMTDQAGLKESELPEKISTIIPVPAPNHPDDKLVNKFSIVMMPFDISQSSAADRCRGIEAAFNAVNKSPDCYLNLFLMDLVAVFPVSLARWFIVNKQCTTVISNLPGPKKSIAIWGYPLEDTMFWLPNVGTSGISVSYLSYGNKLRFGLAVDTGVIPEGKEGAKGIMNWMLQDLRDLAEAAKISGDEMFVRHPKASNNGEVSRFVGDKESEVSSDCGYYGGEQLSDISSEQSTQDTDEEEEELSIKLEDEIVGYRQRKKKDSEDEMTTSISVTKCHGQLKISQSCTTASR